MRRYVCWNIQIALELVAAQVKAGQVDETAELLGQFPCQKVTMSANLQRMYVGAYDSPCNLFFAALK